MSDVHQKLASLKRFTGPQKEFWPELANVYAEICEADNALILAQVKQADKDPAWKKIAIANNKKNGTNPLQAFPDTVILPLADQCLVDTYTQWEAPRGQAERTIAAFPFDNEEAQSPCVILFEFKKSSISKLPEAKKRWPLIKDIPVTSKIFSAHKQSVEDIGYFATALDLLTVLNAQTQFTAATMALCNELASRFDCDQVALGWFDEKYVRLKAISTMDNFEKKMEIVQRLEAAMEEALEQNNEILWPSPENSIFITRDHETLATKENTANLLSVPVRVDNETVAIITLSRNKSPFADKELRALRVIGDQIGRPLASLHRQTAWIGKRMIRSINESGKSLLGLDNAWGKLTALLCCGLLAFLFLGTMDYRVEATFILRAKNQALVPALVDGFIKEVNYQTGDSIEKESVLVHLDAVPFEIQKTAYQADIERYASAAKKANSEGNLADMRVFEAQKKQAEASLKLIKYQIENTAIRAPFDAIVMDDGRLYQRIGSPVSKGDVLFRLAQTSELFAEIDFKERDIHELSDSSVGEIAFASRPQETFPISITLINPTATVKTEGAIFQAKAEPKTEIPQWWKPGMTGIAKIEAGKRSYFWVLTHRLVDWLRIKLWI